MPPLDQVVSQELWSKAFIADTVDVNNSERVFFKNLDDPAIFLNQDANIVSALVHNKSYLTQAQVVKGKRFVKG